MHQIFQDASHRPSTDAPARASLARSASSGKAKHDPASTAITAINAIGGAPPHRGSKSPSHSTRSTLAVLRPDPSSTLPASERGSASWSDDSGYLVANGRRNASDLGCSSTQRVQDWLLAVDDDDDDDDDDDADTGNAMDARETKDHGPVRRGCVDVEYHHGVCIPIDRCASPSAASPLRSSGVDSTTTAAVLLSPLSPNVCIERGPARHRHASCQSPTPHRVSAPAQQQRRPLALRAARRKENLALHTPPTSSVDAYRGGGGGGVAGDVDGMWP